MYDPATAVDPSLLNEAAVTISPMSTQSATLWSGMLQNRSFPSKEPLRKYLSFTGLNAIAVTKSWCEKIRRHSSMVMYHSRTVLSMLDDRSQSV